MRCILHSPGPKCRGGPGEEGKDIEPGELQWKEMDSIFVSPPLQLSPRSLSHGGLPRWQEATCLGGVVLVKGPHCSCVKLPSVCPSARDRGFTPLTYTHTHSRALTDNTPNTHSYYRGAAVWLQLYKLHIYKDDTSFKRQEQTNTQCHSRAEKTHTHTHEPSLCFFSLQAVAAINKAELPHIYIIPTLDSSIISWRTLPAPKTAHQ